MEVIGMLFALGVDIMREEFTIFGYTLSFWNIFIFTAAVGIVAWAVWRLILHD